MDYIKIAKLRQTRAGKGLGAKSRREPVWRARRWSSKPPLNRPLVSRARAALEKARRANGGAGFAYAKAKTARKKRKTRYHVGGIYKTRYHVGGIYKARGRVGGVVGVNKGKTMKEIVSARSSAIAAALARRALARASSGLAWAIESVALPLVWLLLPLGLCSVAMVEISGLLSPSWGLGRLLGLGDAPARALSGALLAAALAWGAFDATRLKGWFEQARWSRPISALALGASAGLGLLIDRMGQLLGRPTMWGAPMGSLAIAPGPAPSEMGPWARAALPLARPPRLAAATARLAPLMTLTVIVGMISLIVTLCLLPFLAVEQALAWIIGRARAAIHAPWRQRAGALASELADEGARDLARSEARRIASQIKPAKSQGGAPKGPRSGL